MRRDRRVAGKTGRPAAGGTVDEGIDHGQDSGHEPAPTLGHNGAPHRTCGGDEETAMTGSDEMTGRDVLREVAEQKNGDCAGRSSSRHDQDLGS
ncbi:MAG: hypothetical protein NVS3B26_23830 [Mycobacteriales bacterium]